MNRATKIALCVVALLLAGAAGAWIDRSVQHWRANNEDAPGYVDPQNQIETVFTPYDEGLKAYLKFLDRAKKTVDIACYGFTEPHIVDKLIELHKRNVKVRILLDRSQSSNKYQSEQIERLRKAGIEVTLGTSPKAGAIMHNKFTVVDGEWTEDGSWNYSRSADKQGNVLNFIRSRLRAGKFTETWEKLYSHMSKQPQKL